MADKMRTVQDLMVTGMTYVLDFEHKASEAAKTMAQAATNGEAKQIFEQSASKGQQYAQRLEQAFKAIGAPVKTNDNHIAQAMITEVQEMISNTDASPVRDAALIVAANQMQHYRVSVYGSFKTYAQLLKNSQAEQLVDQNLQDSKGGDEKLTKIAEQEVNPQATEQKLQNA